MSLTHKLALTMMLPALVALAASVAIRVPRETDLFVDDMQRDHESTGGAVAAAVEQVWEEEGEERAMEVLADAAAHAEVRVRPLRFGTTTGPGPLDADVMARLRLGASVSSVERLEGRVDEVVTYVPLRPFEELRGALVLRESLGMREAYLTATLFRTAGLLVVVALVAAFAASRLGARLFSAPVDRLLDHARRIGEGRFEDEAYPDRNDELGLLGAEMNRMCARLRAAREDIERQNARRLTTLGELRHAERLTTVGKLASGVAHELGTPLHVVIARARRIGKRDTDEDTRHDAESIEREGKRMSRLIRQLLDFSRPREPRLEPVALSSLATETATLLRPMADAKNVELSVDMKNDGAIEGDHDALVQVLTNLVVNGIQATEAGKAVRVCVDEPVRVVLDGEEKSYARVAVSDEGHGIPGGLHQRIFEPFFTTREVGEGTGLGLSVAWGIVREHGGFIDVWSEPGEGSRFTVHLPLPFTGARLEPATAA